MRVAILTLRGSDDLDARTGNEFWFGSDMAQSRTERTSISGYLGDPVLGGYYLSRSGATIVDGIFRRGRRIISEGLRIGNVHMDYGTRCPILDHTLVDFVMTLPKEWLVESWIDNKMLLREFPEYFRWVPWQKTGYPISYPALLVSTLAYGKRVIRKVIGPAFRRSRERRPIVNYPVWFREGVGHVFFEKLLFSKKALYPEFVQQGDVRRLWDLHMSR